MILGGLFILRGKKLEPTLSQLKDSVLCNRVLLLFISNLLVVIVTVLIITDPS